MLSTGLSDLIGVFAALADDMAEFAQAVAKDFLQLLDTVLNQIVDWLAQPIDIPFVSALYHALTGDQLSILDLTCLLGAVPGTILLNVLTGSPTVPDTAAAEPGSQPSPGVELPPGELAGRILLGGASYAINNVAAIFDIATMDFSAEAPSWFVPGAPGPPAALSWLDLALDFIGWAMTMVASYGWATWEPQDWVYWSIQTIPQAFNFGYMFRADGTGHRQAIRDTISGVITLITSAVYAHYWPGSYRDAPKAKGIVLTGNIFGACGSISELLMLFLNPWDWIEVEAAVKMVFTVVGNALGFAANVLDLVD